MRDMEAQGRSDTVMIMTFSEFGRRPIQNASGGADHGTAEPMFILGGAIKGGVHNQPPSPSDLQAQAGDLAFQSDVLILLRAV
jgi:uncharacterized protein (DUF1501 family)